MPFPPPNGTAYGAAENPAACACTSVRRTGVDFFSSSLHLSAQHGIGTVFIIISFAFLLFVPVSPMQARSSQCPKSGAYFCSRFVSPAPPGLPASEGEEPPSSLVRIFFVACFTMGSVSVCPPPRRAHLLWSRHVALTPTRGGGNWRADTWPWMGTWQ